MHLELDRQGPLSAQLMRALKESILSRRLGPGARLPATRELASELELSRNTVLAAYDQLAAEGFLESRTGSGTYVAQLRFAVPAEAAAAAAPRPIRLSPFAECAVAERPHRPPGPRRRRGHLRYNLEYGLPLQSPAVQSAWHRALARAADNTSLDYPAPEGLEPLREVVAAYLGRRRGLNVAAEDVVIVSGAQQGLDLVSRVLLRPRDTAVLEDPHYQGARQALRAHGALLIMVPVDDDGIVSERLPRRGACLASVTPSHQFPTGVVLSLPRRLALLEWARRHDAWILEDDYDGEFRYDTRPLAALKSLDRDDRVLYLGTFSKVLFPALRLGYLVVPPALREAVIAGKWLLDRGCPAIDQHALATLIGSGQFERLLRRAGRELSRRRNALLQGLARHCGDLVQVVGASAGMHVCTWLPRHAPTRVPDVIALAEQRGVGVYPIAPYYSRPLERAGLLLGYSGLTPGDLAEATRRLGAVLREIPSR
jgi:GntR family transcriptional regulator/MocR family aminotransferase